MTSTELYSIFLTLIISTTTDDRTEARVPQAEETKVFQSHDREFSMITFAILVTAHKSYSTVFSSLYYESYLTEHKY